MPKQTKKNVDSISLATPCPLLELPDELLLSIFKYVEVEARPSLVRSCRKLHRLREVIYNENVRARSGQKMYICNCPRCNKVLTAPLSSPIGKQKHGSSSRIITRPLYRGKSYCSFSCGMKQQMLDDWREK